MNSDVLQYEQRGPVGLLALNRPERLNALSHALVRDLRAFFDERHGDYGCRVIIVTGAGRAFCAGLDLSEEREGRQWQAGLGAVQDAYAFQNDLSELVIRMRRCPQPIIAAVNGAAAGGGLSIAVAADVRIGTPAARFACSFVNLGISGCDVGSSYHLPKIVGAHAADLIYSGRLIAAEEAQAIGLLTRTVPAEDLLPSCFALAEEWIRRSSPLGLRLSKEVLNEAVTGISLENALKLENRSQILALQTEDAREAIQAWHERRDPVWRDA
jgi:enoyl-CoA hydratase